MSPAFALRIVVTISLAMLFSSVMGFPLHISVSLISGWHGYFLNRVLNFSADVTLHDDALKRTLLPHLLSFISEAASLDFPQVTRITGSGIMFPFLTNFDFILMYCCHYLSQLLKHNRNITYRNEFSSRLPHTER